MNEEPTFSLENQVVKSNKVIEAMYQLDTVEQKIIMSLCSKISSNDSNFNDFEISASEFANFMGVNNDNYEFNRTLKRKCEALASKTITVNKGTAKRPIWYVFNWFHHIRYEVGTGIVSLQFHEELEPYLLNLKEAYTKYRLGYVMNFKNEYSFRIYELMKQYEKIGERVLSLDDLKSMIFSAKEKEETYQKYSHFKARVINKALEEINKFSDIRVTIAKEEKIGKKVVGLIFEIRSAGIKYPIDVLEETNEIRNLTKGEIQDKLDNLFMRKYKLHFPKAKSDLFDKEAILQTYMEIGNGVFDDKDIKTPIPYFEGVLIKKHQLMTGEEISKTEISIHELKVEREKFLERAAETAANLNASNEVEENNENN